MIRSCLLLLLVASADAFAADPVDFARGAVIETRENQIAQRIVLPRDVYEWASRSDLGDLRVLSAEHTELPYRLHKPQTQDEFTEWFVLPVFPLPGIDVGTQEGARVNVEVDDRGTVIAVNSLPTANTQPAAFLIDMTGKEHEPSELRVSWETSESDFVGKFKIEASSDLNAWRTVIAAGTLASLSTQGRDVTVDRIELAGETKRYLKITQLEGSERIAISAVQGRRRQKQLPERRWKTLTGTETEGGYEFVTGGLFPLDRVGIELEQDSFLTVARMFSRATRDGPWRPRGEHTFYRVAVDGMTASSEPMVQSAREQFWRVELVRGDTETPRLKIGWLPDEVVFLKQESAPYLLVYGQAGLAGKQWPLRDLLSRLGADTDLDAIALSAVGAPETLGGPDRLVAPLEPIDWRTIILWLVLVIGVGVVGVLAYRLVKSPG